MVEEGPRASGRKPRALYLCDFTVAVTKSEVQRESAIVTGLISIFSMSDIRGRDGGVGVASQELINVYCAYIILASAVVCIFLCTIYTV